jgi:hypothetical protein
MKSETRNSSFLPFALIRVIRGFILCLLLSACDRPTPISADYSLAAPDSPSPGLPAKVLLYKGRAIWPKVVAGSEKSFQDGIFVFISFVPDEKQYDFGDSLHLFAVRGEGPPVLISERIFGQAMTASWQVKSFNAQPGGVNVTFFSGRGSTNLTQLTRLATWVDIDRWLLEALGAAVEKATPMATYRALLFKSSVDDTSVNAAKSVDKLKDFNGKDR